MSGSANWGIPDGFGTAFRGRAGVVIEFAPNQFASYVMNGTWGEVEIEREVNTVHDTWEHAIYIPGPTEVRMVLNGTLSSMEQEADRPAWARAEHVLDHRRAIEGRPR